MANTSRFFNHLVGESPVDQVRKQLPHGDGNWPGFDHVWSKLQSAAFKLSDIANQSDDHIRTMAVLGCGDEETMKYWMGVCITNKWC